MMGSISRLAVIISLAAGFFGGGAQAQSLGARQATDAHAHAYYGLVERGRTVENGATDGAAVAPSESHTVMGLRVPR